MIEIDDSLSIDESELSFEFIRSSGPGGQNVNKVATAVRLYFDIRGSRSLPEEVKERLIRLAGKSISGEGVLVILARRHRTQEANRRDALDRLVKLVQRACEPPKKRKPTKPSAAARERRLEEKRKVSEKKSLREKIKKRDLL